MKTISLDSKSVTLRSLLKQAARGEVLFLTKGGRTRFALMPADEGDQEACALRSNAEFLAYLTDAERRARSRPRKSLEEIRRLYGLPPAPANRADGARRTRRSSSGRSKARR